MNRRSIVSAAVIVASSVVASPVATLAGDDTSTRASAVQPRQLLPLTKERLEKIIRRADQTAADTVVLTEYVQALDLTSKDSEVHGHGIATVFGVNTFMFTHLVGTDGFLFGADLGQSGRSFAFHTDKDLTLVSATEKMKDQTFVNISAEYAQKTLDAVLDRWATSAENER